MKNNKISIFKKVLVDTKGKIKAAFYFCLYTATMHLWFIYREPFNKISKLVECYVFGDTDVVVIKKKKTTSLTLFEEFKSNFHFE